MNMSKRPSCTLACEFAKPDDLTPEKAQLIVKNAVANAQHWHKTLDDDQGRTRTVLVRNVKGGATGFELTVTLSGVYDIEPALERMFELIEHLQDHGSFSITRYGLASNR